MRQLCVRAAIGCAFLALGFVAAAIVIDPTSTLPGKLVLLAGVALCTAVSLAFAAAYPG